jgi:L-ribulose-5-phosphate 3-epimerase UlaE
LRQLSEGLGVKATTFGTRARLLFDANVEVTADRQFDEVSISITLPDGRHMRLRVDRNEAFDLEQSIREARFDLEKE